MTNSLNLGIHSVVFEIFGYKDGILNDDGDNLLIRDVHGDNVMITYYDHDYFSNYAKAYIIFQNKFGIVNIDLELRYYGSSGSNFKFLFYSRCIAWNTTY